ncbi:MAG: glutamate--tRNA ligase [Bacilli bacterium]|nr:glutamate--tRNA ligase [Bacilli bacterium]
MTNKEYSNIVIPEISKDWTYYENKYPERNLEKCAMVTRFAPSPTGFVHMGSLYTSFSDLQMAKQTNGVAYLRIEDTDGKRTVENGVEGIINDFKSLNITWDEGPTQGGAYGPYIQSERMDIYKAFAKKLIEEEKAYPCFMTEDEINQVRTMQEVGKLRIGIYGTYSKYRNLGKEEAIAKIKADTPYIIRFKSNGNFENKIILDDLIKGKIEMPENDQDIVIIKSDGLPTYHFAHVVDDHLMRTTHVIRGDEWVSSYPIHDELFKSLGFKLPYFAHIAPITIKEGEAIRKLSKRKDKEAAISYYSQKGIPADVIKLYLATVNNSGFEDWYTRNPNLTIDDYTFEFSKMPIGGSLFDIEKLNSISRIYFSSLTAAKIYDGLKEYTETYDKEFNEIVKREKEYTTNVLNIERNIAKPRKDISSYSDIKDLNWYMFDELFFEKEKNYEFQKINDKNEIANIIKEYFNSYFDLNDDKDTWFNKVKLLCDKLGYASNMKEFKQNPDIFKGNVSDIATVIRVSLTTKSQTPDLYEIMQVMGMDRINKRIDYLNNNR